MSHPKETLPKFQTKGGFKIMVTTLEDLKKTDVVRALS